MSREIVLCKQKGIAIVDDEDYGSLSQWTWYLNGSGYAIRNEKLPSGKYTTILMHRQIMNTPKDMETDHINKNRLDNRRSNLRVCTPEQNRQFKNPYSNAKSKYKGVNANPKSRGTPWKAIIKDICIGKYATEEEAARAYDEAAKEAYGDFAYLNFPT